MVRKRLSEAEKAAIAQLAFAKKQQDYLNNRITRLFNALASRINHKHPALKAEAPVVETQQVKEPVVKTVRGGERVRRKVLKTKRTMTLDINTRQTNGASSHNVVSLKGPLDMRWTEQKALYFTFSYNRRQHSFNLHNRIAPIANVIMDLIEGRLKNPTKQVTRASETGWAHETNKRFEDMTEDEIAQMYKEVHRAFKSLAKNFENRYAIRREIFHNVDFSYNPLRHTWKATFHVAEAHSAKHVPVTLSGPVVVTSGSKKSRIKFAINKGLPLNGMESEYIHLNNSSQVAAASTLIFDMIAASGALKDTARLFEFRSGEPSKRKLDPEERRRLNTAEAQRKLAPKFNRRTRPASRPSTREDAALEFGRGDFGGKRDDVRNKFKTRDKGALKRKMMRGDFRETTPTSPSPM